MSFLNNQLPLPRFKKRAFLEIAGLAILIIFSATQWANIRESLSAIGNSNLRVLFVALVLYWLLLPITSLSYKLLLKRHVPIWSMTLAQLAGSGPGRIVPGGLGRLGVTVLHLKKLGASTQQSIVVSATNNLVGITLNVLFLIVLFIYSSDVKEILRDSISGYFLLVATVSILFLLLLIHILLRMRRLRGGLIKFGKEWKNQFKFLIYSPHKILALFLLATVILNVNVAILLLSAESIQLSISYTNALIALSAGVLIGGILPTPGGLGGVEAGTAGMLFLLGYSAPEATSVAILFRAITYWQPLLPGTIAYFYLKKRKLL